MEKILVSYADYLILWEALETLQINCEKRLTDSKYHTFYEDDSFYKEKLEAIGKIIEKLDYYGSIE